VHGARPDVRETAAFSTLFSSMKLMVEVITSDMMIPRKPFKSRGMPYNAVQNYETKQIAKILGNKNTIFIGKIQLTSPFAEEIGITGTISITHDKGFHINPQNFRVFLSYISYQP